MPVRPTRRRALAAFAAVCLAASGAACRRAPAAASAITLVDDAGDTVSLAAPAQRIVSLIPATTELLYAIGAGDRLVGRTKWCDYPPEAARVPDMGDGIEPNIEAIVAARPDLVLLYHGASNGAAAERLRALGAPTLELDTDHLADVSRLAKLLGRATGHEANADQLVRSYASSLDSATVAPQDHPLKVFVLVWDQPPMTVGSGSFLSELVERAGAQNVFANLESRSAPVSIEAIAAADPDVIVTFGESRSTLTERAEWRAVRAVRERRIVWLTGSETSRPSPRAPSVVRDLATRLAAAAR